MKTKSGVMIAVGACFALAAPIVSAGEPAPSKYPAKAPPAPPKKVETKAEHDAQMARTKAAAEKAHKLVEDYNAKKAAKGGPAAKEAAEDAQADKEFDAALAKRKAAGKKVPAKESTAPQR